MEIPLQAADPQPQTVLTDTYGSASVQLEGTQGTITLRRTPETAAWDADYGIRLEQDRTYPILGIYNEYVDVCIGELGASFHPVVYLLTKDGVVEYVDVLHCLMFGSALVCQDPIYIANQGVALERSGKEVNSASGGWLCAGAGSPDGRVERAGDPLGGCRCLQRHVGQPV